MIEIIKNIKAILQPTSDMSKIRIVLAAALLVFILKLPEAIGYESYLDILRHTSMTLKGQAPYSDVAQDFYGFHALMTNQDTYAILGPALKTIGVHWNIHYASTHPPTTFLIVAPVAWLRWPISSMAWAWLMLICLYLSLKIGCGFNWDVAFLLTIAALLWPPIATSFDQVTIIWLFGLAMAYHTRNRHPLLSGIFIGIASFTKLLPVVLLVPFILRRKWEAVNGFTLSWLTAMGILFLLSPKTIIRYFEVNQTNSVNMIMRPDNGFFLIFLYRQVGTLGLLITMSALFLLLTIVYKRFRQESGKEISMDEWNLYAFLAVLLLPITWIFSIAPLLPNILSLLQDKRLMIRLLAAGALIITTIFPPWGDKSTLGLFGFFIMLGMALVISQSNISTTQQLPN